MRTITTLLPLMSALVLPICVPAAEVVAYPAKTKVGAIWIGNKYLKQFRPRKGERPCVTI